MKESRVALIQLVSEQPMPNLLAALAVRPALCVHVVSPSSRKAAGALSDAIRLALPETVCEVVEASVEAGRPAPSGAEASVPMAPILEAPAPEGQS